jgi:hypothetical protein
LGYVIGTHGLPEREANLLNTILRLSTELQGRWSAARDPASRCDVQLCELPQAVALKPTLMPMTLVIPLVRRGEPVDQPWVLERPVRADDFVALLRRLESLPAFINRPTFTPLPAGGRARLLRWPAQALLGGQAAWFKLATMLSKHALSVGDLSRISGQTAASCELFLQTMQQHGLLEWQVQTAAAPTPEPAPALALAVHVVKPGFLFNLRRKLGLV